jgi:hypothetical protein
MHPRRREIQPLGCGVPSDDRRPEGVGEHHVVGVGEKILHLRQLSERGCPGGGVVSLDNIA